MKKNLEKIIHTIIPHEKNGNIPHILRGEFIFILVVFTGVLFYFNQNNFNIIKNLNLTATVYPAVLADLANKDRALSETPPLIWSETLAHAAKLKAQDMLTNSYFAHTSPAGVTPWHWLREANYNFVYAGENLAVDFTESANVERAWIASPKHRENIMNSNFTEIGIATIDGVFEGRNTTFVVEFFGSPAKEKTLESPIVDNNLAIAVPEKIDSLGVAGVSIENITKEDEIKVIQETKDFIVVKNDNAVENSLPSVSKLENKNLSTWYGHFIVNPLKTVKIIYIIIFCSIFLATVLVLSREYRKYHTKHLLMGTALMVVIVFLFYIVSINNTQIF